MDRFFIVANQPAMMKQPSEGSLHHPPFWQDSEAPDSIGASDDFHLAPGRDLAHPGSKHRPTEAAIGEDFLQALLAKNRCQQFFGTGALGQVGLSDEEPDDQTEGIDTDESLAAFGLLGRIVAHRTAMPRRANRLAVDHRCSGSPFAAHQLPNPLTQHRVELLPHARTRPHVEMMIDALPCGKVVGQESPRTSALGHVENGIDYSSQAGPGPSRPRWLGKLAKNDSPLEVRQIGVVLSDFHRSKSASRRKNKIPPKQFASSVSRPSELSYHEFSDTL